ncbi:VOC family protein [Kitasatospora sp. NPDC059673]|uniref:VOC family protein n=1 Tax=Kitasatospora sp. NPDC059673 TaxID=3346901 RepID=UPI0036C45C80
MAHTVQMTIDCEDPASLAEFWALALDYVVQPPPPGFDSWEQLARRIGIPEDRWDALAAVVDPAGVGPRVLFQKVPERKTLKNRAHLDIQVSAPEGHRSEAGQARLTDHVARLVDAGAKVVREVDEPAGFCVVMQDPEGNEFCVA